MERQIKKVGDEKSSKVDLPNFDFPSLCILSGISNFKHQILRYQDYFDVVNENGMFSEDLFRVLFDTEWQRFLRVYEMSDRIPDEILNVVLGVQFEFHKKVPRVTAEAFLIYFDWNMSVGLQDYRTGS